MEFDCLEEDAEGRGLDRHAVDDLYCLVIEGLDVYVDVCYLIGPLGSGLAFACFLKRS